MLRSIRFFVFQRNCFDAGSAARKFVQLDLLFYFRLPTTPISELLSLKLNWYRYNDLQHCHHLERYKDSEVPA